jgi:hypothetical protein
MDPTPETYDPPAPVKTPITINAQGNAVPPSATVSILVPERGVTG